MSSASGRHGADILLVFGDANSIGAGKGVESSADGEGVWGGPAGSPEHRRLLEPACQYMTSGTRGLFGDPGLP